MRADLEYLRPGARKMLASSRQKTTMTEQRPMLEVIDENTLKINGVEYKKVKTRQLQTLKDIILEWWAENRTGDSTAICEKLVDRIENWMSQYKCDYVVCVEYLQGYNALMETLKAYLK